MKKNDLREGEKNIHCSTFSMRQFAAGNHKKAKTQIIEVEMKVSSI